MLEEVSRKVTVWIDTVLEESESRLLEENLLELEEEEGPVLDLIDDLVENVLIICVPPSLVKSREKLTEDDVLSDLSIDKCSEEHITNITEININDLVIDLYNNALEYAERKILETHEDYILPVEISNVQQSVDLLSIGSESDYVLEDIRGELNKLVDQILDNLITVDSQFQDEIVIGDDAIETSSELGENTNNLLQASQDLVLQEHNVSINEDLNITEQSETFNVDLEHKGDDIIVNDLTNKTIENNKIVKEIIDDLLKTGVSSSDPNVLDDNYTKPNNTEIVKQESLEIETQLDNEQEYLQNEAVVKDNESQLEGQDFTQIKAEEGQDLTQIKDELLSAKISERTQIVQDLLITIFENLSPDSAFEGKETNEDNKKVKFSAIDMGIEVNKKLLTKLSSQQLILQKPSSDYLNFNIDFAPPNENLLSDVDESWPQNIALPIIKVTESVNKSVTSLGKIFERDENRISSESSYVSTQNSEMLIDVQLTSMSMDNSKMNDMLLEQFQNENEIGTEAKKKKGNDKPQRKEIDKKKQVKNKIIKNETKHDLKPRGIDKNKLKDTNGKIRNKSVEVHQKPEKKYIKTNKDKEIPRKDKRLPTKDKIPNKTDRIKVSDNKRDIAKIKINENKTGIKQKKQLQPVVSVKEEELITEPIDVISKEDRGDGLKNEQKQAYSCEKFLSSEQKTNSKENGMMHFKNTSTYFNVPPRRGLERSAT
ncbi:GRIP and coiled-coil domain-containing protein 2-like [Papilio machaon]|uniref:GRIP and coiled-coil domain-containing protein 2-like n=1 Tax=Papilio machaon TaxID=76193 RepID=UPI001E665D38|nr:GRIP and coiled-coil domain-containing protein 2-like [Papilio machaon]